MVEVIFEINGIQQTQMAVFDSKEDAMGFCKTFKDEVLEQYPNAENIHLGKFWVSI